MGGYGLMSVNKNMKFKCTCTGNEEFGDYSRMTTFNHNEKTYQVDKCMEQEIKYLLNNGVNTIECCCGHNQYTGYIAVNVDSIEKMFQLGYKKHTETLNEYDYGIFLTKTI